MPLKPLRLCQVVALEKGVKSGLNEAITKAYHLIQRPEPFAGQIRIYEARDDDGEVFPSEGQKVTAHGPDVIDQLTVAMARLIDVLATKIEANTLARADVVLEDGTVVLKDVPIETLLLLERQLTDCATFIGKLPVLDPNYDWEWDDNTGCWATEPVTTYKSTRIHVPLIKAPATDKHAAQVDLVPKDVVIGQWSTTKLSGALPLGTVAEYKRRVVALQGAVKMAREAANTVEAKDVKIAKKLFDYLWAP